MVPVLILLAVLLVTTGICTNTEKEHQAREFLLELNNKESEWLNKAAIGEWGYASNLTDENLKAKLDTGVAVASFHKWAREEIGKFDWRSFTDESLKRQFKAYYEIGPDALSSDNNSKYEEIISKMENIYATAKICIDEDKTNCSNSLEPELSRYFATSKDPELLKRIWLNWRQAIGPNVKEMFEEYVNLANEAARLNDYEDNTEYWLRSFEDPSFRDDVKGLWEQLKPLYQQIHAYVRYQLRKKYGEIVSERGPIPAHLLGNIWSQAWSNIRDFTLPFPNKGKPDLTKELRRQNYTVRKIFDTAESFFKSINLTEMPQSFWERSVIEKPNDRELICHASAWDFYDGEDFRIKQCTEVTFEYFHVTHHEMGHIEYFLHYKNQPVKFKSGANYGFHEAVGDLISLSVRSNKHLRKLGLLDGPDDEETLLNSLFETGLDKIAFLPFGYLMDLWRWDVFKGKIKPEEYNCKWWDLSESYQGIEPPVDRSENDFDPAAKYHIIADVPYIRYFVSFVVQFQFHQALCQIAGEYDPNDPSKPLYGCDIYGNTKAGNALKQMLAMGSSRPWPDAMEVLTGQRKMDGAGMLEYFKPLQTWLEKENAKNGVYIGWEKSNKVCRPSTVDKS